MKFAMNWKKESMPIFMITIWKKKLQQILFKELHFASASSFISMTYQNLEDTIHIPVEEESFQIEKF